MIAYIISALAMALVALFIFAPIYYLVFMLPYEIIREVLYRCGYRVFTKEELRKRPDYKGDQNVFEAEVVNVKDFDSSSVVRVDPFANVLREMDENIKYCKTKLIEPKRKRKRT